MFMKSFIRFLQESKFTSESSRFVPDRRAIEPLRAGTIEGYPSSGPLRAGTIKGYPSSGPLRAGTIEGYPSSGPLSPTTTPAKIPKPSRGLRLPGMLAAAGAILGLAGGASAEEVATELIAGLNPGSAFGNTSLGTDDDPAGNPEYERAWKHAEARKNMPMSIPTPKMATEITPEAKQRLKNLGY
jgi:hypothetical protein